jgi:hypothetical protein
VVGGSNPSGRANFSKISQRLTAVTRRRSQVACVRSAGVFVTAHLLRRRDQIAQLRLRVVRCDPGRFSAGAGPGDLQTTRRLPGDDDRTCASDREPALAGIRPALARRIPRDRQPG